MSLEKKRLITANRRIVVKQFLNAKISRMDLEKDSLNDIGLTV